MLNSSGATLIAILRRWLVDASDDEAMENDSDVRNP